MPIDTCDRVLALLLAYFRRLTYCAGGVPAGGGTGDIGAVVKLLVGVRALDVVHPMITKKWRRMSGN